MLTQAREHIIKKTVEALKGAKNAIIHLYNSTSTLQREVVFRKSKEEIKQLAVDGAKLVMSLVDGQLDGNIRFEYSPEVSLVQSRTMRQKLQMPYLMYSSRPKQTKLS